MTPDQSEKILEYARKLRCPWWRSLLFAAGFLLFWMTAILFGLGIWAGLVWIVVKTAKCAWGA